MDEENETIEKPDEPEKPENDIIVETSEGEISPFKPEEPELEPCDPATMNCDQMRDRFKELSQEQQQINATVLQLEKSRELFHDPDIDTAYSKACTIQHKVTDEIDSLVEASFGKNCRNPSEKPEA